MDSTTRRRNSYDHRLHDLVRSTGILEHATSPGVPRSTARDWLSARPAPVGTLDVVDPGLVRLQREVLALRRRADRLLAVLRVVGSLGESSGHSVSRILDPADRLRLLAAIDRSRAVLPLRVVLRIIGMRPAE